MQLCCTDISILTTLVIGNIIYHIRNEHYTGWQEVSNGLNPLGNCIELVTPIYEIDVGIFYPVAFRCDVSWIVAERDLFSHPCCLTLISRSNFENSVHECHTIVTKQIRNKITLIRIIHLQLCNVHNISMALFTKRKQIFLKSSRVRGRQHQRPRHDVCFVFVVV